MEINYELTTEDFLELTRITARENKTSMNTARLIGVVFVLLIVLDFIYCIATGLIQLKPSSILLYFFGRLLFQLLFLLASVKVLNLASQKMADKTNEKAKTNGVFCEHKIILDEEELIEITDINTSRYSWKAIGEISENEGFVVIPVNLSYNYVIPKRFFSNEKHIKEFIDTANEYKQNAELRFNSSHFAKFEIES